MNIEVNIIMEAYPHMVRMLYFLWFKFEIIESCSFIFGWMSWFLRWYEGSFRFYCYREIIESVLGFSACLVLIIDFLFFLHL